ncbi:MAG TPA: hypothetical protein DDW85_07855 [Porphyromonadaceae bacterium]|nr:hypothetical protein [Porphyromonadaceae bacterium]
MERDVLYLIIACLLFLFISCRQADNEAAFAVLQKWDTLLPQAPYSVKDSLAAFHPEKLSSGNRAYYGLLKTIADDKTYTPFASDSLINSVEKYYRRYRYASDNHIRALTYQSIVRTRIGITDSTVYIPLKMAEKLFLRTDTNDPRIGYLIYYYLGDIHCNNTNYNEASAYFRKALLYAKKEENQPHIYDIYLALFWNAIKRRNINEGKSYLKALQTLPGKTVDERYFLANAEAVYYDIRKEYAKALEKEREQLTLSSHMKEKMNPLKACYSFSERFLNLNQLDSAMHYALLAIKHITDTTYTYHYLLYENVANIVEKQGDYLSANNYRKKAAEVHNSAIQHHTHANILELEKKYNLSEARNETLRMEKKTQLFTFIILLLVLVIILFILYFSRKAAIAALTKQKLLEENKRAEAEARLLRVETEQKAQIFGIYKKMITQDSDFHKELLHKREKYIKTNPELVKVIDQLQQHSRKNFKEELLNVIPTVIFKKYVRDMLPPETNDTEKLILFLLACKVSNKEIALILRMTDESLRSRKYILKDKFKKNGLDTALFN